MSVPPHTPQDLGAEDPGPSCPWVSQLHAFLLLSVWKQKWIRTF